MTWRCITCERPMFRPPPVTLQHNGADVYMGRKCAIRAGLIKPKRRAKSKPCRVVRNTERQIDIFDGSEE